MKKLGLIFAALVLPSLSAHAQALPHYNPEAYCQEVADVSGGSSMIFNGCIDMEQESYNNLKAIWQEVPSRTKSYCDEVGQVSGGSYSILEGCIDMELDAASSSKGFQF